MAYPRSFLGLLLSGFTLVTVPLVGALAYSAWHTEQLAEQSRSAMFSASQAARASRALVNRIASLERLAQQMTTLDDPKLVEDFHRVHESFRQVAADLLQLPLDDGQRVALKKTIDQEALLFTLLSPGTERPSVQRISEMSAELADNAYEVLAISSLVADREVARLRADAELVQRQLILLVLFGTAVALAIALALTRYISRPIHELDASIRQLGSADFTRPIHVPGPEDLQTLGERLDWLRARLAELEAQKNRLLRHLSHELKTPLTALREGTELLHDGVGGPLSAQQRQVVSIMRDNGIKLQRLIEDLLNYQRAVHSTATLRPRQVPLDRVVREVARTHELAMRAKEQRLQLELSPLSIEGDEEKLRSIVDNLVGNAVKFTPAGGAIAVAVRAAGDDAAIEVLDSGPGVPAEERDSVFDSFFRGRAKASGPVQGTGLGLAIARELAEAHGGRIKVMPHAGAGAFFRVTLPRRVRADLAQVT